MILVGILLISLAVGILYCVDHILAHWFMEDMQRWARENQSIQEALGEKEPDEF